MISGVLSMTKPAIATAVPVQAFSSEITTGMSAPPIGRVPRMPKPSAAAVRTQRIGYAAISGCVGDAAGERDDGEDHAQRPTTGKGQWPAGNEAGELTAGDQGTREGDGADEQAQKCGEGGAHL